MKTEKLYFKSMLAVIGMILFLFQAFTIEVEEITDITEDSYIVLKQGDTILTSEDKLIIKTSSIDSIVSQFKIEITGSANIIKKIYAISNINDGTYSLNPKIQIDKDGNLTIANNILSEDSGVYEIIVAADQEGYSGSISATIEIFITEGDLNQETLTLMPTTMVITNLTQGKVYPKLTYTFSDTSLYEVAKTYEIKKLSSDGSSYVVSPNINISNSQNIKDPNQGQLFVEGEFLPSDAGEYKIIVTANQEIYTGSLSKIIHINIDLSGNDVNIGNYSLTLAPETLTITNIGKNQYVPTITYTFSDPDIVGIIKTYSIEKLSSGGNYLPSPNIKIHSVEDNSFGKIQLYTDNLFSETDVGQYHIIVTANQEHFTGAASNTLNILYTNIVDISSYALTLAPQPVIITNFGEYTSSPRLTYNFSDQSIASINKIYTIEKFSTTDNKYIASPNIKIYSGKNISPENLGQLFTDNRFLESDEGQYRITVTADQDGYIGSTSGAFNIQFKRGLSFKEIGNSFLESTASLQTVANIGDINGDSYDDLAVGFDYQNNGNQKGGLAFVFLDQYGFILSNNIINNNINNFPIENLKVLSIMNLNEKQGINFLIAVGTENTTDSSGVVYSLEINPAGQPQGSSILIDKDIINSKVNHNDFKTLNSGSHLGSSLAQINSTLFVGVDNYYDTHLTAHTNAGLIYYGEFLGNAMDAMGFMNNGTYIDGLDGIPAFGKSMAYLEDNVLAIGIPQKNVNFGTQINKIGSIYIVDRNNIANMKIFPQSSAGQSSLSLQANSRFGYSLAYLGDYVVSGTTYKLVAVGEPGTDTSGCKLHTIPFHLTGVNYTYAANYSLARTYTLPSGAYSTEINLGTAMSSFKNNSDSKKKFIVVASKKSIFIIPFSDILHSDF